MPDANQNHALAIVTPSPATQIAAGIPRKLTRSQVADMLGVSISSVRRLERERLHAEVGADGYHYFDPAEVAALASELAAAKRPARPVAAPPPKLSAGELAARAFECFEQRQSLAEVVIALRVEPRIVRELFHEWQVGLTQGELRRAEVALPPGRTIRHADRTELGDLLASLPVGEPTRVSVARLVDDYEVAPGVSHHELVELGGFVTHGPLTVRDLVLRYGQIAMRVTACTIDPVRVRWEILVEAEG
jgi:hypothetical protein